MHFVALHKVNSIIGAVHAITTAGALGGIWLGRRLFNTAPVSVFLAAETDRVCATALRLAEHMGAEAVDEEIMRLACDTHLLLQPPNLEVGSSLHRGTFY